jgi:hypothetical protein
VAFFFLSFFFFSCGALMLPFAKTDEGKLETDLVVYKLHDDIWKYICDARTHGRQTT